MRILVVGEVGCGKTSLCNAMTGQDEAVSDNSPCTNVIYEYLPLERGGERFVFVDTPGAGRPDNDALCTERLLLSLDYYLQGTKQLDLIVLVGSSCGAESARLWRSLCSSLERRRASILRQPDDRVPSAHVPLIYVATGCERREDMMSWAAENDEDIRRSDIQPDRIVGGTFAGLSGATDPELAPFLREKREETIRNLWNAIDACRRH